VIEYKVEYILNSRKLFSKDELEEEDENDDDEEREVDGDGAAGGGVSSVDRHEQNQEERVPMRESSELDLVQRACNVRVAVVAYQIVLQ